VLGDEEVAMPAGMPELLSLLNMATSISVACCCAISACFRASYSWALRRTEAILVSKDRSDEGAGVAGKALAGKALASERKPPRASAEGDGFCS